MICLQLHGNPTEWQVFWVLSSQAFSKKPLSAWTCLTVYFKGKPFSWQMVTAASLQNTQRVKLLGSNTQAWGSSQVWMGLSVSSYRKGTRYWDWMWGQAQTHFRAGCCPSARVDCCLGRHCVSEKEPWTELHRERMWWERWGEERKEETSWVSVCEVEGKKAQIWIYHDTKGNKSLLTTNQSEI